MLDRLPASAAIIGADGIIEFVNGAWLAFGRDNGRADPSVDVGRPYRGWGTALDDDAIAAATGVLDVIEGRAARFSFSYACHSPTTQRWFEFIVVPLTREPPRPVLSMHMPVSADSAERLRRAAGATTHRLTGLVMVCAWCATKELSLTGEWVAHDPSEHAPTSLSHGMCPDCATSFR